MVVTKAVTWVLCWADLRAYLSAVLRVLHLVLKMAVLTDEKKVGTTAVH